MDRFIYNSLFVGDANSLLRDGAQSMKPISSNAAAMNCSGTARLFQMTRIELPGRILKRARLPIERMLEISAR